MQIDLEHSPLFSQVTAAMLPVVQAHTPQGDQVNR
jgi:hypothetical protein